MAEGSGEGQMLAASYADEKLTDMLLRHHQGILNGYLTKGKPGVAEAVDGNFRAFLRRGRGYRSFNYLQLQAQRQVATRTEFVVSQKAS